MKYNFLPVQLRFWNIHEIFSTVISLMVKYLLLTKHDFLLSIVFFRFRLDCRPVFTTGCDGSYFQVN